MEQAKIFLVQFSFFFLYCFLKDIENIFCVHVSAELLQHLLKSGATLKAVPKETRLRLVSKFSQTFDRISMIRYHEIGFLFHEN